MAKLRTGTCSKCGATVQHSHMLVEQVWDAARGVDVLQHKHNYGCAQAVAAVSSTTPALVAPATTTTPRAAYAQSYAASAPRGVCRGCGGPVSAGGAYCGEC